MGVYGGVWVGYGLGMGKAWVWYGWCMVVYGWVWVWYGGGMGGVWWCMFGHGCGKGVVRVW